MRSSEIVESRPRSRNDELKASGEYANTRDKKFNNHDDRDTLSSGSGRSTDDLKETKQFKVKKNKIESNMR